MKDPTETRDIGPRVGSPLWFYVSAVIVLGVGAVVFAESHLMIRERSHPFDKPQFWVLAAMILLAEMWPIVTPGRSALRSPTAAVTFSFAVLLAWGLAVA